MKKNILYFVLFSVLLLSSCANNGLSGVSSEAIPEAIPEGEFCKHAQYTLKETYSDYQEALADYNMLLNQYKDHQQDLSCRDHVRSTEKLELDSQKMQKIINELKKLLPPPVLTDQEKLDKIQYSIDSLEEDLCMNLPQADRDKNQKMYDQHMELKKQYESGKITLDEYYEKFRSIKYE